MSQGRAHVYRRISELDFQIADLPLLPLPDAVLFVRPTWYEVSYVINPHMESNVGTVQSEQAHRQWEKLVEAYRSLGLSVHEIDGVRGLPDMVFCANQTLPAIDADGGRKVVLSNMSANERRDEVIHFRRFFEELGYGVHAATVHPFEGAGDALWHFDRELLWIGTGFRSARDAPEAIGRLLGVRTIGLNLIDPLFYHLDTCLSFLNAQTALWVPSAFDHDACNMLRRLIPHLIEVPREEALSGLSCNAHCPDGQHVVIQSGCRETTRLVRDQGFDVIACDTGEFLKSGGSVFCLKQMFWEAPDERRSPS